MGYLLKDKTRVWKESMQQVCPTLFIHRPFMKHF